MNPSRIVTKPVPSCPDCGAQMALRKPPPGNDWRAFWGCSRFPECKATVKIGDDGKPETDSDKWWEK